MSAQSKLGKWTIRFRYLERIVLDFLGAPSSGHSAALFRLAFGALSIWYTLAVYLNLDRYYSNAGLVPWQVVKGEGWRLTNWYHLAPESTWMPQLHLWVLVVATVGFVLGFGARAWTVVIALVHISLQFRNPYILNSGDRLFQIIAGVACVMPLDAKWSVRSWLRSRRGLAPLVGNVAGQRLIQMQIAYVYIASAFAKLANRRWQAGVALRDVLSSPVFAEWPTHVQFFPLVAAMTYGTLLFELAFPVLIWWRKARYLLLGFGIVFHLLIDILLMIPIFSAIMIVCYVTYLSDEDIARGLARYKAWRVKGRVKG